MRKDCPSAKENEVVHGCQAKILTPPELRNISEGKATCLHLAELEKFVGAKEGRKRGEGLHDNVTADDDGEQPFLKETPNHPRVNRLGAHQELSCDASLAEEVAEEFKALDHVELFVVPRLALRPIQRIPRVHDGEREETLCAGSRLFLILNLSGLQVKSFLHSAGLGGFMGRLL